MKLLAEISLKGIYNFFTDKNYRQFLKLVLLYGNKPRFTPHSVNFFSYSINTVDSLSFVWQFKEIFVDENYKFRSETANPVIYDCGANIGVSCLYFKHIYPQAEIKAFEAVPSIAEILKKNLSVNRLNNVEVINKAVWINNSGIEMTFENADSSSIFKNGKKQTAASVRLKDLLDKETAGIDLLKIDIEGAETDVLKDCGASLENVKNIFVEYHSFVNAPQNLNELLALLTKHRFRYFIKNESVRKTPFLNKRDRNNPDMDLQLNIFAYKI